MKIAFIFLLLVFSIDGFCCTCAPFNQEDVNKLIQEAEYVLVGTPVEFLYWRSENDENWNEYTRGTGIKLQVDSVMKGRIKDKYVFINQFSNGNCVMWFELGEKYIILGYRIKKFIDARPKEMISKNANEIPESLPPPPPMKSLVNEKIKCYDETTESIEYWNKIASVGLVLHTSQCDSFHKRSTVGSWFLNQ